MQTTRRRLIRLSAAAALTSLAAGGAAAAANGAPMKKLRILILGGTGFIGPHQVRGTYAVPFASTIPCPAPPSHQGCCGLSVGLTPNAGLSVGVNVSPPSSDFEHPVTVELPDVAPPLIAQK